MRFPNPTFPENGVMRVTNPRGEVQEYPYWEAPFPPPAELPGSLSQYRAGQEVPALFPGQGMVRGPDVFFRCGPSSRKAVFSHRETGIRPQSGADPGSLRPCLSRILRARFDAPFRPKVVFEGDRTFPFPVSPYLAAKWDYWAYGDIPSNLVLAYDLIRESGQVDDGMKRRIEDDLIRGSVSFVRSYPITLSNMDPTILHGLISAGRVLAEPEYVHEAVDWIGDLIRKQFFVDGMWREAAVSYHNQTVGGLAGAMDLLDGYSDPEGYVHPETGARYESLDLSERFPLFRKGEADSGSPAIPERTRGCGTRYLGAGASCAHRMLPALSAWRRGARLAGSRQWRKSDAGPPALFRRLRPRARGPAEHYAVFSWSGAAVRHRIHLDPPAAVGVQHAVTQHRGRERRGPGAGQ